METYMARTSLCLWILCTKNDVLLLEAEMLAGAAHTNRQIRTVVWCDAQGESYGSLSLQDPCGPVRLSVETEEEVEKKEIKEKNSRCSTARPSGQG